MELLKVKKPWEIRCHLKFYLDLEATGRKPGGIAIMVKQGGSLNKDLIELNRMMNGNLNECSKYVFKPYDTQIL